MKRFIISGLIILVLVAAAGYIVWTRMNALQEQMAELNQQVTDLNAEARQAEERAERAEARAGRAEEQSLEAEGRAESASQRAQQAEDHAFQSNQARLVAEEARDAAQGEAESARLDSERKRAEIDEIRKRREEELERLESALGQIAETRRTAVGLVMNLSSDRIEFDFDKANLRPENRELLSRVVGVLMTASSFRIEVFGHTDDVGTIEYNQELSEHRAQVVSDYLVESGIDEAIITTKGFGKSKPLVEGTDSDSRQRNRRVEIGITQSLLEFAPVTGEEGR